MEDGIFGEGKWWELLRCVNGGKNERVRKRRRGGLKWQRRRPNFIILIVLISF